MINSEILICISQGLFQGDKKYKAFTHLYNASSDFTNSSPISWHGLPKSVILDIDDIEKTDSHSRC